LRRSEETARRATHQDRAQPAREAPREIEQLAQRGAERHFVDARPYYGAGKAEQLRAGRAGRADRRERRSPFAQDPEHVDEGFNVVDHGRPTEQARLRRERRLVAQLSTIPFDRVEQSRLLAADVGPRAAKQLDVEGDALA